MQNTVAKDLISGWGSTTITYVAARSLQARRSPNLSEGVVFILVRSISMLLTEGVAQYGMEDMKKTLNPLIAGLMLTLVNEMFPSWVQGTSYDVFFEGTTLFLISDNLSLELKKVLPYQ